MRTSQSYEPITLFKYQVALGSFCAGLSVIVALFIQDYLLAFLSFLCFIGGVGGLITALRGYLLPGVNFMLFIYLGVFTYLPHTHLNYLPMVLMSPVVMTLGIIFHEDLKARILYTIACIASAAYILSINYSRSEIKLNNYEYWNMLSISTCVLLVISLVNHFNLYGKKKAEENLKETKKLIENKNETLQDYIESNIKLEQFAHIASHDLRSPLVNIKSFADLLVHDEIELNQKDKNIFAKHIANNSKLAIQMINQLLEYAKTNALIIEPVEFNSKHLIQQLISDFKTINQDISLEIKSVGKFASIYADKAKFKQIFQILISNAIKFTNPVNGVVRINIENIEDKNNQIFSVKDFGIGIPEDQIQKIFNPYVRLHNRSEYDGVGLGLSICKKIVELHNGTISCTSQKGVGSTFTFTIPKT